MAQSSETLAGQPSVAFYYGNDVPLDMLDQFDWAVVEAAHMDDGDLAKLQRYGTTAFAYVSLGEAEHWRADESVPQDALKKRNKNWNSSAADLTRSDWADYLINQRIRPLWEQGYRAFFLDTLDSYRLFAEDGADAQAQQQALVAIIKRIHDTFPGVKLLLNRGFEVLDQVHDDIVGVAAESLYQMWDPSVNRYRAVRPDDTQWLLDQLQRVRNQYGLPAIAIDYVDPAERDDARATAQRIAKQGIVPWVTSAALDQVGVGKIEPMPRKVLIVWNPSSVEEGELNLTNVHRYAAMPLEYLGYGADYRDVNEELPTDTLRGRYAGVVTWFSEPLAHTADYRRWLVKQVHDGVHVAIFGDPGVSLSGDLGHRMGVELANLTTNKPPRIVDHDDMVGFEGMPNQPPVGQSQYYRVTGRDTQAHLTLRDADGQTISPVFTGDWGGVALSPWVIQQGMEDQMRWIVDPFKYLTRALDLPAMPVPDSTTENGSRYWMTEIDGDGFVSRAAFPGTPFNGQLMLDRIFKRYKVPTTVSIIEGELAPDGLYPELTDQVEPIARRIFKLPWVEIGTHTYSHPFDWLHLKEGDLAGEGQTTAGFGYNLPIKGYHFSIEKEVAGSTRYINENLAPPGKRVKVVLWSGDSLPPRKALALSDRMGLANINGGDTSVRRDAPTLTDVSPMLRPLGGHVQVFSPMINENVYTNDMTGPLWGFRRVIETYQITDSPRRLKPIDIYYHFYSAAQPASLNALQTVYDYVLDQQTLPVYASTYSEIARNWLHVGLARDLDGDWQVTGATQARTLRVPRSLGWPDVRRSDGVVGVRDIEPGRYIALSGAPRVRLALSPSRPSAPYIERSNGRVQDWQSDAGGASFRVQSEVVPLRIQLGGVAGCRVHAPVAAHRAGDSATLRYSGTDSGRVRIDCG